MNAYPSPDGGSGIGAKPIKLMASYVLIALALLSSQAWSQTNADLKAFETRLNAAWTEGTESAFRSLFYTEGADQGHIESNVRIWRDLKIRNSSAQTITVKALYTKDNPPPQQLNPLDEALHTELVKSLADPSLVFDGQTYLPTLESAGIAVIVLNRWKELGPLELNEPVGYDSEKKLRLTLFKATPKAKD